MLFTIEAQQFLKVGLVRQAIEVCKRGLVYFPKHVTGYVILAQAYRDLGQIDRAVNVLRDGFRRTGAIQLDQLRAVLAGEVIERTPDTSAFAVAGTMVPFIPGAEQVVAGVPMAGIGETASDSPVHGGASEHHPIADLSIQSPLADRRAAVSSDVLDAGEELPQSIAEPSAMVDAENVAEVEVVEEILQGEWEASEDDAGASTGAGAVEEMVAENSFTALPSESIVPSEIIPAGETAGRMMTAESPMEVPVVEATEEEVTLGGIDELAATQSPTHPEVVADAVAPESAAMPAAESVPMIADAEAPSLPVVIGEEAGEADDDSAEAGHLLETVADLSIEEIPDTEIAAALVLPLEESVDTLSDETSPMPELLSAVDSFEDHPFRAVGEDFAEGDGDAASAEIAMPVESEAPAAPAVPERSPSMDERPGNTEPIAPPSGNVAGAHGTGGQPQHLAIIHGPRDHQGGHRRGHAGGMAMPGVLKGGEASLDRERTLSLALHPGHSRSRLRSSNLRLIPGLEFAPLRQEDHVRRQPIAPLINEPMPELTRSPRNAASRPEQIPLPATEETVATAFAAGPDEPVMQAVREEEPLVLDRSGMDLVDRGESDTAFQREEHPPAESLPSWLPTAPDAERSEVDDSSAENADLPAMQGLPPELGRELGIPMRRRDVLSEIVAESEKRSESLTPLEELARRLEKARIPVVEEPVVRENTGKVFEPAIVSETLANILLSQGAYSEALKAFRTLARTRADRSEYFQEKIREIEQHMDEEGMSEGK